MLWQLLAALVKCIAFILFKYQYSYTQLLSLCLTELVFWSYYTLGAVPQKMTIGGIIGAAFYSLDAIHHAQSTAS